MPVEKCITCFYLLQTSQKNKSSPVTVFTLLSFTVFSVKQILSKPSTNSLQKQFLIQCIPAPGHSQGHHESLSLRQCLGFVKVLCGLTENVLLPNTPNTRVSLSNSKPAVLTLSLSHLATNLKYCMIPSTFSLGIKTWTPFFYFRPNSFQVKLFFSLFPTVPRGPTKTRESLCTTHPMRSVKNPLPNPHAACGHFPNPIPKPLLCTSFLLHFLQNLNPSPWKILVWFTM